MASIIDWLPRRTGLRILMYHRVSPEKRNGLTVTVDQFRRQLDEIVADKYPVLSGAQLSAVVNKQDKFIDNPLMITFDDGSRTFLQWAWPELKARNLPAVMFLPMKYIGGLNGWDKDPDQLMSGEEIRALAAAGGVEFALHGWAHTNYRELSLDEIKIDLRAAQQAMKELAIPHLPALAYPYGGWPKAQTKELCELLRQEKISWAVRIGNRLNRNAKDPYFLHRFDIRGDHSHNYFRWQIRCGAGR